MSNKTTVSTITLEQNAELNAKINMIKNLTVDVFGLSNGLQNLTQDEISAINNIVSILERVNDAGKSTSVTTDEAKPKTKAKSVKDFYNVNDIVDLTKIVPGSTVADAVPNSVEDKSEPDSDIEEITTPLQQTLAGEVVEEAEVQLPKKRGRKPGGKNSTTKKDTTTKKTATKKTDSKKDTDKSKSTSKATGKKPGRKPGRKPSKKTED